MVFFICEACQESLKTNAVEKHSQRCRNCWALTCVDCSKTFEGEAYKEHKSCVSEAEKYEKALYKPKNGKAAKKDPQAEWTELIEKAAAAGGKNAELLGRLVGYTNVPRKLKPFMNFAKNSLKVHNDAILNELFATIQALVPPRETQAQKKTDDAEGDATDAVTPPAAAGDAAAAVGQKRKRSDAAAEDDAGSDAEAPADAEGSASSTKFDFKKWIVDTLSAANGSKGGRGKFVAFGGKIKAKRLRQGAVAEAQKAAKAAGGELSTEKATEKFEKKFAKLLKKGKVSADGKYVVLAAQ